MEAAVFGDSDDPVCGYPGFVAVKDDISGSDGCGFNGCDRDDITIAYRRIHAVTGSAKLNTVTFLE